MKSVPVDQENGPESLKNIITVRLTNRSVTININFHNQRQQFVLCGVLALHIVHVNPASRPPHGPHHGPHDSQQLLGGDGAAAVLGGD